MSGLALEVRDRPITALLVFADIVDSSKYSAVLGYTEYARRLFNFQHTFRTLGKRYFPDVKDPTREYSEVQARGDEGIVFFAETRPDFQEMVFRAIEFLFHLKGRLRLGAENEEEGAVSPRRIGLGAGIHVGKVAFATKQVDNRSVIHRLEGFSINYAKRVESCSRIGQYSHIFLSKEAGKFLEDKPVVLARTVAPMKGIEEKAEVYEVQSGLFGGLRIDHEDAEDSGLLEQIRMFASHGAQIDEPWIKSLVVSILDWLIKTSIVQQRRVDYQNTQLKLAWRTSIEDDPILLYLRARDFGEKKEYTQQIRYLKQIVEKHPEFVHARKRMIKACWEVIKGGAQPKELVFARDMAKEFLDHFPRLLDTEEKKDYRILIDQAKSQVKGERRR